MTEFNESTDLTLGEVRSILATMACTEAESIAGWLIIVQERCDCDTSDCDNGPVRLLSSRSTMVHGTSEPAMLAMAANAIKAIAQEQDSRA